MKRFAYAIGDCLVLSGRGAKHIMRRIDTLITSAILPIIFLLLFKYLFGGAMGIALGDESYLNYVLPGILLMSFGFLASTTATAVNDDMAKGLVARLRSMPVARPVFIVGHIFASLIRNSLALICVVGLALALGYRSPATFTAWLCAIVILLLFALAMTSIAVVMGFAASSPDAASAYGMPLMFLPYFTGAFVPIETMPQALQVFCARQPVNTVWKAISGLTLGGEGYSIWAAIAWCAVITIIFLIIGGLLFSRTEN
ncbi:MAG: ABC transporter permease [Gracilibacteraceae bacterium]|jgi:ABC-2 type transport system permease protein|nr:ABC transporter permease [Gracilibacteraceae bacterium]